MKHIDIIIPTRNRLQKLYRTIESIPIDNSLIRIVIVCDGDENTFLMLTRGDFVDRRMLILQNSSQMGSVYSRNRAIEYCDDGVLYATDDIVFDRDSISNAISSFNTLFNDDDGVIGFKQINSTYHPTGVALVGRNFIKRYPNRKLFYPKYFHFSCQEVHEHAVKLNRFHLNELAMIEHFHPDKNREDLDSTHSDARKFKDEDFKLRRKRKELGLIWGYNDHNIA